MVNHPMSTSDYLGFKPDVTKEQWITLFEQQDIQGMLDGLHKFHVEPGDTYLIEGGTPHAIGAGCLLAEIQEPTDYTIRLERKSPSGLPIDDWMCHQGLGFQKMFDCFKYENNTREETLKKWHLSPTLLSESTDNREYKLIGYDDTPYFRMTRLEVETELALHTCDVFYGLYWISGHGEIIAGGEQIAAYQGDQFFVPAKASDVEIKNHGDQPLKMLRIWGLKSE